MNPALAGRTALAGLGIAIALFAGTGAAQARFYYGVGIGLPGVVVAPPVVVAPAPVVFAPPPLPVAPAYYYAPPVAPAPAGYVWVPGAWAWNGVRYGWGPGPICRATLARRGLGGWRVVPRAVRLGLAGRPLALMPAAPEGFLPADAGKACPRAARGTRAHLYFSKCGHNPVTPTRMR